MDEEVGRPRQLGISHLGLSVTDLDRSVTFYCEVLGAEVIYPRHAPESFSGHRTVVTLGSHLIDLNQFSINEGTKFDPSRTGLDHLALDVASQEDLEAWAQWLDANNVARSTIRDAGGAGAIFDFVDPDGIQIEFFFRDPASRFARKLTGSGGASEMG
jgi:glyoxylase I family protein